MVSEVPLMYGHSTGPGLHRDNHHELEKVSKVKCDYFRNGKRRCSSPKLEHSNHLQSLTLTAVLHT